MYQKSVLSTAKPLLLQKSVRLKVRFEHVFHLQAFKDTGKAPVETEVAIHRIRITLTSRNVKSLEKGEYLRGRGCESKT